MSHLGRDRCDNSCKYHVCLRSGRVFLRSETRAVTLSGINAMVFVPPSVTAETDDCDCEIIGVTHVVSDPADLLPRRPGILRTKALRLCCNFSFRTHTKPIDAVAFIFRYSYRTVDFRLQT